MENIKAYFYKVLDYFKKLDKKKRNILFITVGATLVASIVLAIILNRKDYVVLYNGLEAKECAQIVKTLDEKKINYKVERESTIYVDKKDEPAVKLDLASEGFPKSTLNYDTFKDNVDFMTTDFEKNQYSLFQLQERLQASIETLDVVNKAIVTISLPNNNYAVLKVDKVDPSASAILNLKSALNEYQINGIKQLLAKSVPGLKEENISIIDQTGKILDAVSGKDALSSTERVSAQDEVSAIFADRISSVLSPIYGKDNLSIGVNVNLNYDKNVKESVKYEPSNEDNTGVITSYDKATEGNPGADAGAVPGTQSNLEKTGTEVDEGTGDSGGTSSSQMSVDYLVSKITEQIQKEGAKIEDIKVAVLINKATMSELELASIKEIVANTVGIAADNVTLSNMEFVAANAAKRAAEEALGRNTPKFKWTDLFSTKYIMITSIIGGLILILFILILIIVSKSKKRKKQKAAEKTKTLMKEREQKARQQAQEIEEEKEALIDIAKITETKENQFAKEIRDFSMKSPQVTAMLIRTLLKGEKE